MERNSVEEVVQQVEEIFAERDKNLRAWLYHQILLNALRIRTSDLDELDLKVINRAMAEFRHAARVFKPYRQVRKVSIFGSARTPDDHPHFDLAVQFARDMVDRGFMVITGAADGIMKAGNLGAGSEKSFGANILLPIDSRSNEVIADDPKLVTFRYFFVRKLFFIMEANALALFPGGFGTHDEAFEALTLLQTGKTPPMPVVLLELPGDDYWESWDAFIQGQMLTRGLISEEDLSLYKIAASSKEAAEWIAGFYSVYHSMRQVRNKLVIRLQREMDDRQIDQLNDEFRDLVGNGKMKKTEPLPAESNQPDLLSLPRVTFNYRRARPGRLNQLILKINGMTHDGSQPT